MKKSDKYDFSSERERQHNIVFPDTTANEANFFRNLLAKPSLTPLEWLGVFLLAAFVVGFLVAVSLMFWTETNGPWWLRALNLFPVIVATFIVIVLLNISKRAKSSRSAKKAR